MLLLVFPPLGITALLVIGFTHTDEDKPLRKIARIFGIVSLIVVACFVAFIALLAGSIGGGTW